MKNSARSENRRKSLNSIGLSSLLVIFVVLASITLSVMCLITVRQDLDRAKKLAVTHEEYYSADTKATEKLDRLYLLLADDNVTDISAAARELGIEVTGGTRENRILTFSAEPAKTLPQVCPAVSHMFSMKSTTFTSV